MGRNAHLKQINEGVPQFRHDGVRVLDESGDPRALVRHLLCLCPEPKVVEVDVRKLHHEFLLLGQQKGVEGVRLRPVELEYALLKGAIPEAANAAMHQYIFRGGNSRTKLNGPAANKQQEWMLENPDSVLTANKFG